jgi:hypothetical protein
VDFEVRRTWEDVLYLFSCEEEGYRFFVIVHASDCCNWIVIDGESNKSTGTTFSDDALVIRYTT